MRVSICMPSYNRPEVLRRTLESIYAQTVPFDFETIVVDDGDVDSSLTCAEFPVTWIRSYDPAGRHMPSVCRNLAYRKAQGEIIISQSDDVIHHSPDAIERLVGELQPGSFVIATVLDVDDNGKRRGRRKHGTRGVYTGLTCQRPRFFLGSLWRDDLYAIGGCDETFGVACEDSWFGQCLIHGRKLTPYYSADIIGWHQYHERNNDREESIQWKRYYFRRVHAAMVSEVWSAVGGPWI